MTGTMESAKRMEAAARVEELAAIAKQLVLDLRDPEITNPYARLYWLRGQFGKVTARFGAGVPAGLDDVGREYEALVGE
jgi:hypothetical protein